MRLQLAPQRIITLSALFVLLAISLSIYLATRTPWLGLTFAPVDADAQWPVVAAVDPDGPAAGVIEPGAHLHGIGGITLTREDLREEPDTYRYFRDYNAFLERQARIAAELAGGEVLLRFGDDRFVSITATPERPISALPLMFWYQLACGSIVFMAGMSVLAFQLRERVVIYYALTGFGLLLASAAAAIYSSRELALDGEVFYRLSLLNQFGSFLFAGTFISILWYYPQRIHPFPFGPVFIAGYIITWLLALLQVPETLDAAVRYPMFIGLALNLSMALTQWRRSRSNPVNRAILKWFLLAWLSGTTLYLGLYTVPLSLQMETVINQSLGWGILVTVYLGVAFGITRYRLFNLDRWVVTGWFWFLGGVSVIAVDLLLIGLLDFNNHLALAVGVALAGWIYFPIRQMFLNRFSWHYRRSVDYRELLPSLLMTALSTRATEMPIEWRRLHERIFYPLNIDEQLTSPEAVVMDPEGSSMTLPAFHTVKSLRLTYADRGSRLFTQEDRRLAEAVYRLFNQVQQFREAFNNGVQEERKRVARDLHDDVGAKLLTLIYSARDDAQGDLARETLQELRDVIRGLEHTDYSLLATLGELRREAERRCSAHGIELSWQQQEALGDTTLEARYHANMQRMLREALSNALRHSDARLILVTVRHHDGLLELTMQNDHARQEEKDLRSGRGMHNIRARVQELGGHVEWVSTGGQETSYTITITIPLEVGDEDDD